MKEFKMRPHLKRNLVVAAVLVLVGTAAYLNWSYNARWGEGNTAMAEAEDEMTTAVNVMAEDGEEAESLPAAQNVSDYFAEARLTRQQSRDQALSLLEQAACAETASQEVIDKAMNDITVMANWSLLESQIENELLAKEFAECVVYFSEDKCTVAVPSAAEGLTEAEVARITDAVMKNSSFDASQINVIEVMPY